MSEQAGGNDGRWGCGWYMHVLILCLYTYKIKKIGGWVGSSPIIPINPHQSWVFSQPVLLFHRSVLSQSISGTDPDDGLDCSTEHIYLSFTPTFFCEPDGHSIHFLEQEPHQNAI